MIEDVLKKIAAPGAEFRGAPFWAWNAKLEPEELRRQIRLFKKMGLGGFFMHARVGLNTPYLSEEWFNCIKSCIDEAEKQGMKAWLYDEDRWPSGAAGGFVTKNPKCRQHQLVLVQKSEVPQAFSADTIALFAAVLKDDHAYKVRKFIREKDTLGEDETLLIFENREAELSSWYNGQTYLDTMNTEAVAKFIETTHEAYRKNIAEHFGKTVPGIFTDEPNYFHGHATLHDMRPWNNIFSAEFQKKYGYRVEDHLVELFFIVEDELFSKARLDYYNLATTLYVNAFSRLCGKWCEEHNLLFTGHDLCEDDLVTQTACCGAAMRFYEFQQQPGIDLLTEHWNIFDTAKQCSSMAHQFNRQWRLSETYGCTGWDFPFMGHKALGDWQFALGINFRCQHLAWYSMSAEAKRDYPASISYQSPWFDSFGTVEEYFARLGAALSEGEEQRDLLVIHPIESTWGTAVFAHGSEERNLIEAESLVNLSNRLLEGNLDFDYGDEEIMSRYGKTQNNVLTVNHANYKAVLIPPLQTIRQTTLELLDSFRKAGGSVFYLGAVPRYVDGILSAKSAEVFQTFEAVSEENLIEKMSPAARRVSITDAEKSEIAPALYLLRKAVGHQALFICNTGAKFGKQKSASLVRDRKIEYPEVTVRVKANPEEKVYELDLMTGNLSAVPAVSNTGWTTIHTSLPKLGSRLFILSEKKIEAVPAKPELPYTGKQIVLPSVWQAELDDHNVFVLDHAAYFVDGKPCGTEYILTLDDKVRSEYLKTRPRGGQMVQPWMNVQAPIPEKTVDLKLEYHFHCAEIPKKCFLGIERPDLYEMELNGRKIEKTDCGFWCDLSMRKIALAPELFRQGENTLVLKCRYHEYLPGLEMIYLLGDFGVQGDTLTAPVRTLAVGDWCQQGLPNYAGNLVYRTTLNLDSVPETAKLVFGEWRGVGLAVSVNGTPWKMIPWPPFECDLSGILKPGKNNVAVKILGHRRNSHGPFYCETAWPNWTGPNQFKEYFGGSKRKLVPCGVLELPILKF